MVNKKKSKYFCLMPSWSVGNGARVSGIYSQEGGYLSILQFRMAHVPNLPFIWPGPHHVCEGRHIFISPGFPLWSVRSHLWGHSDWTNVFFPKKLSKVSFYLLDGQISWKPEQWAIWASYSGQQSHGSSTHFEAHSSPLRATVENGVFIGLALMSAKPDGFVKWSPKHGNWLKGMPGSWRLPYSTWAWHKELFSWGALMLGNLTLASSWGGGSIKDNMARYWQQEC